MVDLMITSKSSTVVRYSSAVEFGCMYQEIWCLSDSRKAVTFDRKEEE